MSFDKIIYRLTDKRIPAATGIGLVGDILDHAEFQEQFRNVRSEDKRSRKQIDCGAIMTTFQSFRTMPHTIRLPFILQGAFHQLQRFVREWMRSEKHSVNSF